jgi:hypothetical protein
MYYLNADNPDNDYKKDWSVNIFIFVAHVILVLVLLNMVIALMK